MPRISFDPTAQPLPDLQPYKAQFARLQPLVFSEIQINGMVLRVLGIDFMDYGPNWQVRTHRHTFFEFHYVTARQTWTAINGAEQLIRAGSFYLMPPGTFHAHRDDSQAGHIGFALRWELIRPGSQKIPTADSSGEMDRLARQLAGAHSAPVCDDGSVLAALLDLLHLAQRPAGLLALQLAFVQILFCIAELFCPETERPIAGGSAGYLENRTVDQAIRFIDENFNKEIGSRDVAASVHMSYSHLSRLFQARTGQTICRYLQEYRLHQAEKLLLCTPRTIAQIARETGFASDHYFCAAFRQAYGASPGIYRKGKNKLIE